MTEFKQIIGRGTRINEEFGKRYFTIMDFRNVTDLFADPDFDGDPVMVKQILPDAELTESDIHPEDEPVIDAATGEEVPFGEEKQDVTYDRPEIIGGGGIVAEPQEKVYVAGVDVSILNERVQYLGANGKLTTGSLKEYTRNGLLNEFRTLDNFLSRWNSVEKKKAVIDQLAEHDIILENLQEEIRKELDIFDLICHIAWDRPPLSRRERAEQVIKRDYFTKYGDKARTVLQALLDKYAKDGIENIEEMKVLTIDPFKSIGTPTEIVNLFGGKAAYQQAVKELETEIYRMA